MIALGGAMPMLNLTLPVEDAPSRHSLAKC